MEITANGWVNKTGTSNRQCGCGSWAEHWINFSGKKWPKTCSVSGCTKSPVLGAHIHTPQVSGEQIVPMCNSCNGLMDTFNLKGGVTMVSANKSETCDKT